MESARASGPAHRSNTFLRLGVAFACCFGVTLNLFQPARRGAAGGQSAQALIHSGSGVSAGGEILGPGCMPSVFAMVLSGTAASAHFGASRGSGGLTTCCFGIAAALHLIWDVTGLSGARPPGKTAGKSAAAGRLGVD